VEETSTLETRMEKRRKVVAESLKPMTAEQEASL